MLALLKHNLKLVFSLKVMQRIVQSTFVKQEKPYRPENKTEDRRGEPHAD